MPQRCFQIIRLTILRTVSWGKPYFKANLFISPGTLLNSSRNFVMKTASCFAFPCFSPFAWRFLKTMSSVFVFRSPKNKCSGLTHFLLSQRCSTQNLSGILPINNVYDILWARTVFLLNPKSPYPFFWVEAFQIQQFCASMYIFSKNLTRGHRVTFPAISGI